MVAVDRHETKVKVGSRIYYVMYAGLTKSGGCHSSVTKCLASGKDGSEMRSALVRLKTAHAATPIRYHQALLCVEVMVIGITINTVWYRILFKDRVGWILAPTGLFVNLNCPLLPKYPPTWPGEDTTRYASLDSDVDLSMLTATPAPDK